MEVAETPSPNPNPKNPSLCQECNVNPSKYKCPGCSIRSCSLPCVKSHKHRTSCTGKRPRTQFVPISQFDDNLLISDYNLLEEAKRVAESAKRMRNGLFGDSYFKLPSRFRYLKNAAARRKTHLLLLPSGMSKREKNQSRYNQRKKLIFWTIEWRFHSTDVVLIDNGVDENASLCSVIEKHLKPSPWNTQLKPFYEQLDSLKFFIRKNAKGTRSPFRELDIKAPISQQLANVVIVEYPIIHVFLPSANLDFEIIKDVDPLPRKSELKDPLNDDIPSPKGVLFREEEIQDDISVEPHILDLMNNMNPEVADDNELHTEKNDISQPAYSPKEFADADFFGFDFGEDLRDTYSDLMGQANSFLDLDGFLEVGLVEDEELEEGEIRDID